MNNRIITIFSLILFTCQYPVQAHNNKEKAEIEKLMQNYYKIYIKGNWPELVNHLYPKVIAIKNKHYKGLKLIEKKPETSNLLSTILPSEVYQHFSPLRKKLINVS